MTQQRIPQAPWMGQLGFDGQISKKTLWILDTREKNTIFSWLGQSL